MHGQAASWMQILHVSYITKLALIIIESDVCYLLVGLKGICFFCNLKNLRSHFMAKQFYNYHYRSTRAYSENFECLIQLQITAQIRLEHAQYNNKIAYWEIQKKESILPFRFLVFSLSLPEIVLLCRRWSFSSNRVLLYLIVRGKNDVKDSQITTYFKAIFH